MGYVNNMGGVKLVRCDLVGLGGWIWCCSRRICISVEHIPGPDNTVADRESGSLQMIQSGC